MTLEDIWFDDWTPLRLQYLAVYRIKLCIYDFCSYFAMILCSWIMMAPHKMNVTHHKMKGKATKFTQIHPKHPWFSINFNQLQLNAQHCLMDNYVVFGRRFSHVCHSSLCPRNAVLSECSAGLVALSAFLVLLSVRRGDGRSRSWWVLMGFPFWAHQLEHHKSSLSTSQHSGRGINLRDVI